MKAKVERFIEAYGLIEPGDRVIAAVSGGADSVCLLDVLEQLRGKLGFSLRAVHVHHGLRGKEADRDAEFTQALCERLRVPGKILHADVRGYAARQGCSEEEAGRLLRYELLEKEAASWELEEKGNPVKIAAAHHGDDSTETILYNLFRGTGLLGLGGIRPMRGRIIRPLLCTDRREILEYLMKKSLDYCEDSTNTQNLYARNRIRNEILPLIQREENPRAGEHIRQAGERIRQADEFIRNAAREWLEARRITVSASEGGQKSFLLPEELGKEPDILQAYILQNALAEMTGTRRDLTARHIKRLQDLLAGGVGRRADLAYGIRAVREYRGLRLVCRGGTNREKEGANQPPNIEFTIFSKEKNSEFPKNQYTKWFDYDKIKNILSVRTRQTGDFISLAGGGTKSVKAYMIDEKIPASQRDSVFLLADGSHIIWIIGYRISEYYKIGPQTKTILQAQISGGEYHGR